jgi:hypothetical protein
VRNLATPLAPSYASKKKTDPKEKKKKRLSTKADKANAKAKARGEKQVGTRKTMANPRTLTQGSAPVYKREKKIRDKIKKVGSSTPKKPKQSLIGRVKDGLRTKNGGIGKNKKTKAQKAKCSFDNKRGRQRNKRKHSSCK